jgi:hypothetical protein
MKSEMTAGTLVSKPTTSSIPRSFGSPAAQPGPIRPAWRWLPLSRFSLWARVNWERRPFGWLTKVMAASREESPRADFVAAAELFTNVAAPEYLREATRPFPNPGRLDFQESVEALLPALLPFANATELQSYHSASPIKLPPPSLSVGLNAV